MNSDRVNPVFVVGVPRSGTTLLAAMLGAHSMLGCGPETSFFNEIARVDINRILSRSSWPDAAVDFLFSMRLGGEPVPERYHLSREDVHAFLSRREPTIPSLLEALTEQYAQRLRKVRWVEKSPSHLIRGAQIRRHYPDAPIIRIIRDPRDVALSLQKVPWGVTSFIEGLLYWREFDEEGSRFYQRDAKTLTIRYEDLVLEPETILARVCGFIGVAYEKTMLDTRGASEHVQRGNESWKDRVGQEIDRSRVAAWRTTLASREIRAADSILGDRIRHYGYPLGDDATLRKSYMKFYPLRWKTACNHDLIEEYIDQGSRFWPVDGSEEPTMILYQGNPGDSSWIGHQTMDRVAQTCAISAEILRSRLRGQRVMWVRRPEANRYLGVCGRIIDRMFGLASKVESLEMDEHQDSEGGGQGVAHEHGDAQSIHRRRDEIRHEHSS